MSWSVAGLTSVPGTEAAQRIDNAPPSPNPVDPHVQEQVDVAKTAAKVIIASGTVGDPAIYKFNISLSGHSNEGHEPADGWANDCLNINISQATA